jgi:hypothetical protein
MNLMPLNESLLVTTLEAAEWFRILKRQIHLLLRRIQQWSACKRPQRNLGSVTPPQFICRPLRIAHAQNPVLSWARAVSAYLQRKRCAKLCLHPAHACILTVRHSRKSARARRWDWPNVFSDLTTERPVFPNTASIINFETRI